MTTPAATKKSSVPKTVWDLIFTLLIPILILSPNILGSGVSVANLMGGGTGGNVRAYLIAALIPVAVRRVGHPREPQRVARRSPDCP